MISSLNFPLGLGRQLKISRRIAPALVQLVKEKLAVVPTEPLHRVGSKLRVRRRADNLVDTVVVEPDGYSAGGQKNRNAIAIYQRPGMIDLKSTPPMQFHRENLKWPSVTEGIQGCVKVLRCHVRVPIGKNEST